MLDVSFYNYLSFLSYPVPVQQDKIDAGQGDSRIWFQRRNETTDLYADGTPAETETTYDVEICTSNIDATQGLSGTIRTGLNGFHGLMGLDRVLGVFVADADDNYVSRSGLSKDAGLHIAAFQVRIIT